MNALSSLPDKTVALLMALVLIQALILGGMYVFRSVGNKKANICFGGLLFAFALAIGNNLLARAGLMVDHHELLFLPIWFTLSFGPLLFYYVKFSLYPSYEIRSSDGKHFILPILQTVFYLSIGFRSVGFKQWIWDVFIAPFYKTFEGVLFVASFFTYLALAYRYIKFKQATLKKRPVAWESRKTDRLQRMMKWLFVLTSLNTFYIITDFITYNYFNLTLYKTAWFSILGDVSFAAMLLCLSIYGWRTILGNYHAEKAHVSNDQSLLEQVRYFLLAQNRYKDPDMELQTISRGLRKSKEEVRAAIRESGIADFPTLLEKLRLEAVQKQLTKTQQKKDAYRIAFEHGFPSKRQFDLARKQMAQDTGCKSQG